MNFQDALLLRIYVDENDKVDGHTAYRWVVNQALEQGMKGATALRGMEGYGSRQQVHSANLLTISSNLPVVIEIIDGEPEIMEFVSTIQNALTDGLISLERVRSIHLGQRSETEK